MLFKDIIGLQHVKEQLCEMVAQNRLSHALLFLGKEGSGALPIALCFAQFVSLLPDSNKPAANTASLFGEEPAAPPLLPQNAAEADAFMQQHPAFSKASNMVHPDIHFSYPVIARKSGDKPLSTDYITEWREFVRNYPYGNAFDWLQFIGAENKQGNISAYECNDIIHKLNLKSFESPYKILVMWMPEYLGKEGNKLLKLIEEPPANTLFILVAENDEQILPTILSRCQLVKIPQPANNDIEEALVQRSNLQPEAAQQIAAIAEGNYREALQLSIHAEEDWINLLSEWLKFTLRGMLPEQVKWVEEISKLGREKQKQMLLYFNHLLEQAIRLRVMGSAVQMADNEKDFAGRINKITSVSQQQVIIEELDKAAYYIERNANAKMLFHALTIKLYHIIQDKALFLTN